MQKKLEYKKLPSLLRSIHGAPKSLYYEGDLEVLEKTCLSIVGTRHNSDYGECVTQQLVNDLAVLDITIISGLAKGIDTIAHQAALDCDIPTVAVLGSGLSEIYPQQNKMLAEKIKEKGLLLSEYSGKQPPLPHHFPQRNRIVSGLSVATIVIEAPKRSGALITANLALDQGREVFVIPGDIDRENSMGCLHLMQKGGAYPIGSARDVIEILQEQPYLFNRKTTKVKESVTYKLEANERLVLEQIPKRKFRELSEIKAKIEIDMPELLAIISLLEIKCLILNKHGRYRRLL